MEHQAARSGSRGGLVRFVLNIDYTNESCTMRPAFDLWAGGRQGGYTKSPGGQSEAGSRRNQRPPGAK